MHACGCAGNIWLSGAEGTRHKAPTRLKAHASHIGVSMEVSVWWQPSSKALQHSQRNAQWGRSTTHVHPRRHCLLSLHCFGARVISRMPPQALSTSFPPITSRHPVRPRLCRCHLHHRLLSPQFLQDSLPRFSAPTLAGLLACHSGLGLGQTLRLLRKCATEYQRRPEQHPSPDMLLGVMGGLAAGGSAFVREVPPQLLPRWGRLRAGCSVTGALLCRCVLCLEGYGVSGSCCACLRLSLYVITVAVWAASGCICVLCPGRQVQYKQRLPSLVLFSHLHALLFLFWRFDSYPCC